MAKPLPVRKPIKKITAVKKPAGNVAKMKRVAPEDIEDLDDEVEVHNVKSGPDNSWSLTNMQKDPYLKGIDDRGNTLAGVNKIVEGNAKRRPTSPVPEAAVDAFNAKRIVGRKIDTGNMSFEKGEDRPELLYVKDEMTPGQIAKVTEARNQYFADNVDLTLAPSLSQYGAAAFYEAAKSFKSDTGTWEEQHPHIQVKWVLVAIAAIGAFNVLPYKSLSLAPRDGRRVLIYSDGEWREADFSRSPNGKHTWMLKSGHMIAADGKEASHYVYCELPARPSYHPHFENTAHNVKPNIQKEAERPSRITREIRSAAPAALAGSVRDGKPRSADYYPPPSSARVENIRLAKAELVKLSKPKPGVKLKPVKLR